MEKTLTKSAQVYSKLYKNAKMGFDSVVKLMEKASESEMKMRMTEQMKGYESFAAKAKSALNDDGFRAEEESAMTKFWATMGMKMNTMMDSSDSHIAQMMIEGSTMGITDTGRMISEYEKDPECKDACKLAQDMVEFEERNVKIMQNFL